jgi:hypothetical protein
MRQKTHISLANQIASKTGISIYSEEAAHLRGGSIAPDKWKNYPHHYGKDGSIRTQIMNSRKCWLNGEKENCCFRLGVAFHYLADKWTLMRGSDPRHGHWEQSIEESAFADDTDSVVRYSGISDFDKEQYYSVLEHLNKEPLGKNETLKMACIGRPSRWSSPPIDLNMAYKVCLRAAQSVFSSVIPPLEIQERIDKSSAIMEEMTSMRFFQFAWYLLMISALVSVVPLFAINNALFFLIFMALLFLEIYSTRMFFMKGLSAFKKLQAFRSIIKAWILMFILFFVVCGYAGIILISGDLVSKASVLVAVTSLILQIVLPFRLNEKIKANELSTYLDWFNDPEDSPKIEKPLENAPVPNPSWEQVTKRCPDCGANYFSVHEKCPYCDWKKQKKS